MFLKKIVFRNYFIASFALSALTSAGILLVMKFLPPVIPLFYGKPSGDEQLVNNIYLFLVPVVSLIISGINVVISNTLNDEFTKKVLAVSSFVISFMATVTVTKIILLVGLF